MEVPQQPGRDECPAAAGRSHGGEKHAVDDVSKWVREVLSVIPPAVVAVLPEDLDRRLGAPLLLGRHIQVIHKQDAPLVEWRAESVSPPLLELGVDEILCLVLGCLGAEPQWDVRVLLPLQRIQHLKCVRGLAGARRSAEEGEDARLDVHVGQIGVPDHVDRLNDDLCWLGARRERLRALNCVHPLGPCVRLRPVDKIETAATLGEGGCDLLELLDPLKAAGEQLLQGDIKTLSRCRVGGRANRPDYRKDAAGIQEAAELLVAEACLVVHITQGLQQAGQQLEVGGNEVLVLAGRHLRQTAPVVLEQRLQQPFRHRQDLTLLAVGQRLGAVSLHPAVDEVLVAHCMRLEVHHSAPADGRR
mmetsp:Transcript_22840/g.56377  ORF Transcript_22840/g.56377 Transcript_22840/m.56377 type:complete len:360 (-) Transcript_22840:328-1407(-)